MMLGAFETSLRNSPNVGRKAVLHKGCSGHLHGHGVKKERPEMPKVVGKTCSFDFDQDSTPRSHRNAIPRRKDTVASNTSSSSGGDDFYDGSNPPDLLNFKNRYGNHNAVTGRSHSSDCAAKGFNSPVASKRSNSVAVVAQRLYSSPTKATSAKVRAERSNTDGRKIQHLMMNNKNRPSSAASSPNIDPDSGHFSSNSDNEPNGGMSSALVTPEERKSRLIHGVSDDEVSVLEMRKRQRAERRLKIDQARKESQSPHSASAAGGPRMSRRSSEDEESSSTSLSPPSTPTPRSSSGISPR